MITSIDNISEIPMLTAFNYHIWDYGIQNNMYLYGHAHDELINGEEISLELPDLDDAFLTQGASRIHIRAQSNNSSRHSRWKERLSTSGNRQEDTE